MCLGFVKSYAGFVAVRALLGITEGGLLPGIVRLATCFSFASSTLTLGSINRSFTCLACIPEEKWP
jgi:hypothetical protein